MKGDEGCGDEGSEQTNEWMDICGLWLFCYFYLLYTHHLTTLV